jgi:hypothetical protein
MPVTITSEQYSALREAISSNDLEEAERILGIIDRDNGIVRYSLYIRWQNVGGNPRPVNQFLDWPPAEQFLLQLDRPIARADVDEVLRTQANNPASVLVTPDVNGVVGWTEIESYNF